MLTRRPDFEVATVLVTHSVACLDFGMHENHQQALKKTSAVHAILAGAALDKIALALFVCHCSPLSFLALVALPAVWVATHGDDARHKRSYVSIEIDNERVRLLFQS